MSHRNPRERFDYKSWFERNVAKRTVAALEARDAAFAEKHADTPLAHLAQYVSNRAELLRHTPVPCEIDGGTFIEERFGSWDAVLEMAHLRPPAKEPNQPRPVLRDCLFYALIGQGKLPLGFINHKHPVKVGFCFHQAGLDGIAQPVLGGLVNHLEWRQGFHSRQRSPGGAGGGKA